MARLDLGELMHRLLTHGNFMGNFIYCMLVLRVASVLIVRRKL